MRSFVALLAQEKAQKRIIFTCIGVAALYMVWSAVNPAKDLPAKIPDGAAVNQNRKNHEEFYRAVYRYTGEDGQTHVLTVLISPQNPNSPGNGYGTVEERATQAIKDAADKQGVPLGESFPEQISVTHIDRMK